MKNIVQIIIVSTLLVGCANSVTPIKQQKNLSDVEYILNKQGDLKLTKSYRSRDGNITKEKILVDKKKSNYEVVPNFEKKYSSSIKIKSNRIQKKSISISGKKVKLSVESIPLNEFVSLVFANVLKLNFTVDESVKKLSTPITLNMPELQPRKEFFEVVKKLLAMSGVSIKKENGILFIAKQSNLKASSKISDVYIGYGSRLNPNIKDSQMVLQFVPYNYIDPKNSAYILIQAGLNSLKFFYSIKGIQIIKGKAEDVKKALNIIKLLDRPYLEGKTPYLIELKNIEAKVFENRIKTIFEANSIAVTNTPYKGGIFMTSIPELNAIYIISPKQSWIDMLMYWKDKLDVQSEVSQEPRFYTYAVKQRKADDLAKALNSVLAMRLSTIKTVDKKNKLQKTNIKKSSSYSVVADLPTNTLMIKMTPSQYREVLPIIEKLDALPLQVLAEVTLAEVTMTDAFDLGFEHTFKNDAAQGGANIVSTAVTAAFGGTGFSATFAGNNLSSVINAYAEKKLLNILSKPKILILNNNTGTINVGKQVPVITSKKSSNSSDTSIIQTVQYRSTGVTVGLTPTINSNGIVTMKVHINLSEAQLNSTSSIDSPLIVTRALDTVLTIKSGNTVLLGGLISTNDSLTNSGVPLLKDVPGLGELFKTTSNTKAKTELIMLIRPYIVHIPEEMSQKTKKYKKMLNLLNKYILF